MILIIGGSGDHNLKRLADAAAVRQAPFRFIVTDADPAPVISWQPGSADITINGETFGATGTGLFIRYDVFSDKDPASKAAFYDALKGWAEACPAVGLLNRANETLEVSKPRALVLAKDCGFDVPQTWITDDFNRFADKSQFIAKPVAGGDYARPLSEMTETPDRPWIVQEKLVYPELRLFRVGPHFFAFKISSSVLDYRTSDEFEMEEVTPPKELVESMRRLTDRMGLDYAAADLKTDPKTGKLLFMEINTMPMFTGYDDRAQGRLSDALFLTLDDLAHPRHIPKRQRGLTP